MYMIGKKDNKAYRFDLRPSTPPVTQVTRDNCKTIKYKAKFLGKMFKKCRRIKTDIKNKLEEEKENT